MLADPAIQLRLPLGRNKQISIYLSVCLSIYASKIASRPISTGRITSEVTWDSWQWMMACHMHFSWHGAMMARKSVTTSLAFSVDSFLVLPESTSASHWIFMWGGKGSKLPSDIMFKALFSASKFLFSLSPSRRKMLFCSTWDELLSAENAKRYTIVPTIWPS